MNGLKSLFLQVDCHHQMECIFTLYGMIRRMSFSRVWGLSQPVVYLSAILSLLHILTATGLGEIIYLKNGKQIQVERVWEEGDRIRYEKDGNIYGFSKRLVEKVETAQPVPASSPDASSQAAPVIPKTLPIEFLEGTRNPEADNNEVSIFRNGEIDYRLLKTLEDEARRNPADPRKKTAYSSALFQLTALAIQRGDYAEGASRLEQYLTWNPNDLQAELALGSVYLKQGKYPQAENILSQARINHEGSSDLNYLLGLSYYLQEKNELAKRFLARSLNLKYRPEVDQILRKVEGENKAEDNFRQASSLHFLVKYEGNRNHEALGNAILASLEKSYAEIEAALDYSPRESIAVILYPDEVFRDVTRTPNWVSALNDGKIRLPLKGISQIDHEVQQMLKHELIHSFIRLKTGDSCPVWLNEGLAQVLSDEPWRDFLPIFKKAVAEKKLPSLMSLEAPFLTLPPQVAGWAYKQSAVAVEVLVKSYGMHDIQRLLGEAGRSADFGAVLKAVLHSDYSDLQQELADYISRQ
jgi:tetratricopeptide (TPR) repeat protein